MDYESPSTTAARLNVTVRAVQKWAKEGRIKGAVRLGREWLIPAGTAAPAKNAEDSPKDLSAFMPMLCKAFSAGSIDDFVHNLNSDEAKQIALAEYSYYTGNAQKAVEIAELYLSSSESTVALSAGFIYVFANLSLNRLSLARLGFENLINLAEKVNKADCSDEERAIAIFVINAACVLLHKDDVYPLEEHLRYLSKGLRLFGAYVIAHKAYLRKDYSYALGVVNLSLAVMEDNFSLPSLYIRLMKCVVLMCLKRAEEAKACFAELMPWLSAGYYQPFAEHHGLLQGVLEAELKPEYAEDYRRIVSLVKSFSTGWSMLHNELTQSSVTVHLSATEFAVAMLFNRGWSVKEIASHMNMSPRMVKHHLSVTYEKLDVSNREELGQFLIK